MTHIPEKFPASKPRKLRRGMRQKFVLADFYPVRQNGAMRKPKRPARTHRVPIRDHKTPWDFYEILARCDPRAREISKKEFGVEWGIVTFFERKGAEDLLNVGSPPKGGHGILRLERAAELLEWTLPQLLGISALDKDKFEVAARIVEDVCGANMPAPGNNLADFLTRWINVAYEIVDSISKEMPGSWQTDDSFAAMLAVFRASYLRNSENAKSGS